MTLKRKIWLIYLVSIFIPFLLFLISLNLIGSYMRENVHSEILIYEKSRQAESVAKITDLITTGIKDNPSYLKDQTFIDLLTVSIKSTPLSINLKQGDHLVFNINNILLTKYDSILVASDTFIASDNKEYNYTIHQIIKPPREFTFINKSNQRYFYSGLVFLIGYILLHFIFFRYVMRTIFLPLNKMKDASLKIRDGDLNFNIDYTENDEVGEVFKAFEGMRIRLKDSSDKQLQYEQNRKELISNISHDLKTPITAINGYVQGIIDGVANTDEKLEKYIQTISAYSRDMDTLIDDLFLFSKLDIQSIPFDFEAVDIIEYMTDCIEELSFDFEQRNIKIISDFNYPSNAHVTIDRIQIRRVINNIIFNALNHFDKSDSYIKFSISESDNKCVLSISDNGLGIAEDKLDLIFNRFYRVDESRSSQSGGSGLGLSISKQIIDSHNGEIWATSEKSQGTTINFSLNQSKEE